VIPEKYENNGTYRREIIMKFIRLFDTDNVCFAGIDA